MLWRLVGSDRMSRLSLCTVSRFLKSLLNVVVGRMVNTRRTRGCCTILTRMTTLVREIIKSEGAPDRAPAEPGVAGRCPISTLQTFTALKGRRAHAHPSHDAARSPSWHAGSCAGGCEGRHRRSHRKGREAHTTGARRPASCPSVENVRYENVLTTKPDLHEVSTVSFVVGTSCGARWPTAIVHEVLFHNMRHKRRRVV
jgi:hypothetical protein